MKLRITNSKSWSTLAVLASFAAPSWAGDFNGDGRADLVIIARLENAQTQVFSAVEVMYANAGGLTSSGAVILSEHPQPGVGDPLGVDFGRATASGDFNGDGFDDLAVSAPEAPVNGILSAGTVEIYLGSATGLIYKKTLHQNVSGMKDKCEAGELFGSALASADFDGDGRDDLAIGVLEKVHGFQYAGAVHVLYGAKSGPSASRDVIWTQNSKGINDEAEENDQFGTALATGLVDGDVFADLVIGVTGEIRTHDTTDATGAIAVIYGSKDGLTKKKDVLFDGFDAYGVLNPPLNAPALGVGDFDKNGVKEIVIGEQNVYVAGDNAGALLFVPIVNRQPDLLNAHSLALGPATAGDQPRLGAAIAIADFNGDGYEDLAAGMPGSGYSGVAGSGMVWTIKGSATGLDSLNGSQYLHRNVGTIFDSCEDNAQFGASLAAGDFLLDGKSELAIGVPQDDYNETDAGSITVLIGTASMLGTGNEGQFFTQLAINTANYFHGEFGGGLR